MAAPGWYHDGNGAERYWDGRAWTEHTRGVGTASPEATVGQPHPGPGSTTSGKTVLLVVAAVVAVLLVGGLAVAVLVATGGRTSEQKAEDAASDLADQLADLSPTDTPTFDIDIDYDGDPESVALDYFDAYVAQDCSFLDLYAPETLTSYGVSVDTCASQPELFFTDDTTGCALELGEVTTTGSSATGPYAISGCADPTTDETGSIEWVLLGAEWKIVDLYPDDE